VLFQVGGLLLLSVDMNKGKDEASQYKADQQAKKPLDGLYSTHNNHHC